MRTPGGAVSHLFNIFDLIADMVSQAAVSEGVATLMGADTDT